MVRLKVWNASGVAAGGLYIQGISIKNVHRARSLANLDACVNLARKKPDIADAGGGGQK